MMINEVMEGSRNIYSEFAQSAPGARHEWAAETRLFLSVCSQACFIT